MLARIAALLALAGLSLQLHAQSDAPKDSATFQPDGTAVITRVVPMPATITPRRRSGWRR
jgi:hypothetical protein